MKQLVLALIRAYQRHLSPYKGFCCAYRFHTGRSSCSALGYRAVRRHGVFTGLGLLRERMRRCGVAHRRYAPPTVASRWGHQAGFCDAGCDLPCDLPCEAPCDASCESPFGRTLGRALSTTCDVADCCGCDWPERRRKDPAREQRTRLPPRKRGHTPTETTR